MRLCPDSQQSSWYLSILDCLLKNGCPRTILCDNDKSLVISHTRTGVRFNPGFTWLYKPFGIVPVACRPRRARTKGRIERTGGYIKQNALAEANAIGNIENIEQLQRFLDQWVLEVSDQRKYWVNNRHQTAESLYEQEKSFLHFVPEDQQAQAVVRSSLNEEPSLFTDGQKALAIDTKEGLSAATSDLTEVAWSWMFKADRLLAFACLPLICRTLT